MTVRNTRLDVRSQAQDIQDAAVADGRLLVWTIFEQPADFPHHFVARPFVGQGGQSLPLHFVLLARRLDEVRRLLPAGLICLPREDDDDPVIVESWM